jgi:hypothetical protein
MGIFPWVTGLSSPQDEFRSLSAHQKPGAVQPS